MLNFIILIISVIDIFTFVDLYEQRSFIDQQIWGAICQNNKSRIVKGIPVDIKDYPHQVSLGYYGFGQYYHFCGASIISAKFVLTAAHCGRLIWGETYVRAGGNRYFDFVQELLVKKLIVHKKFAKEKYDYDIALVKVKGRFRFSPTIQPIKLVDWENRPKRGTVYVTGWGRISEHGPDSIILQYVELELMSRLGCRKFYAKFDIQFTDRMLCAYKENKDACMGDSGGALVYKSDGRQVGIVSWGLGCARPNHPGVFAHVARFRMWIKRKSKV